MAARTSGWCACSAHRRASSGCAALIPTCRYGRPRSIRHSTGMPTSCPDWGMPVTAPTAQNSMEGSGIAVALRAFEGGGAQRDIVLLCNAIAAKGMPVTILTLQPDGSLRPLLDGSVGVVKVAGGKLRYAIPGLRRAIRALRPRVVLASEACLNLCTLAAARSLPRGERPKVALREVSCPSIAQSRDPHLQNRIAYRVLRHAYRHADRVISLTDGARDDLVRHFSVP